MTIETCAKVNLTLELLGRRPDGFHELATVFQAIDLCDRIELSPAPALRVEVTGADLPGDESNLCHRAATLLAEHCGRRPAVCLTVHKQIPLGGGLGGGSGNSAGVLGALARFWQLGLGQDELVELAAELGSDVAFFLRGGAAVGRGRGERLEPLPPLTGWELVVLEPGEAVSTGQVYGAVQGFRPEAGTATKVLAAGLRHGCVPPPEEWLINDLEQPAARVSDVVREDRRRLGALFPGRFRLSGSGGSWFLPARQGEGESLRRGVAEAWPDRRVWLTQPVSYGWRERWSGGKGG